MKKSLSGIRINVFNRNEEISVPLSEKIDSPVVYPIVHNKGKKKINLEELTAEQIEKRKIKRARWGARRLVHEAYVDNFPLLANRFTRERQAAEQKFEYNLGTRAFESIEDADDGMSWLRALFLELDAVVHNFEENDQVTKEEALASIREYLEYELQFWRVQPVRNSPRSNSNSPPPSLSNYQIDTTSHKNVSPDQPVHQDSETKQNDETNIQHNKQSIEIHNFYFNEPGPLGMDLKPCELGISVIRIKPASPADISGIKANDVIIGINQFNTDQIRTRPKEESMALFSQRPLFISCARLSLAMSASLAAASGRIDRNSKDNVPKRARVHPDTQPTKNRPASIVTTRSRPPMSRHNTAPSRILSSGLQITTTFTPTSHFLSHSIEDGDGIAEPLSARSVETETTDHVLAHANNSTAPTPTAKSRYIHHQ